MKRRRIVSGNQFQSPFPDTGSEPPPSKTDESNQLEGWRAWYANERVFSSDELEWTALPDKGVLGVVAYHEEPYRTLVSGGDWYWMENGIPTTGGTTWDGWVDPPDNVDPRLLKQGIGVPDEEWEAVRREMTEAKEWL